MFVLFIFVMFPFFHTFLTAQIYIHTFISNPFALMLSLFLPQRRGRRLLNRLEERSVQTSVHSHSCTYRQLINSGSCFLCIRVFFFLSFFLPMVVFDNSSQADQCPILGHSLACTLSRHQCKYVETTIQVNERKKKKNVAFYLVLLFFFE